MIPELALEHRAKVEEFRRRHRVGLLTLLFTDLVGSTKAKQQLGDSLAVGYTQQHHAIVRETLSHYPEGEEISTAGDSFFIIFAKPSDAVQFALYLQHAMRLFADEIDFPMQDRIGIHLGEVIIETGGSKPKDLYGIQVDVCSRVMSLASGEQILLTRSVFDNARQVLKGNELPKLKPLSWLNHGFYSLKGVEDPLEICEVGETAVAVLKAPADSDKANRHRSGEEDAVLGWRPAVGELVPNTQWELERKLGEGGFGEVWVASHALLKEKRVFKFCFRADRVRSLKRELTLFRVLRERVGHHPNIVGVQDVFLDSPPFYLMMDYADGQDLESWVRTAKSPNLQEKLTIVLQVAGALGAAHEAGVIHRDLKPSNIIISRGPNGEIHARLTDFGIGKVVSSEVLSGMTKAGFTLTMAGDDSRTGTLMYMAPELWAGRPASAASDIYALGVVLYQLLVQDFSRPVGTDWRRDISDELLCEDLEKCLASNPANRFNSAGAFMEALRGLEIRRKIATQRKEEILLLERRAYQKGMGRSAMLSAAVLLVFAGVALYARHLSREAEDASRNATRSAIIGARYAHQTARLAQSNLEKLVDSYADKGASYLKEGDTLHALLCFAEALQTAEMDPAAETKAGQMLRVAFCLANSPKLIGFLVPKEHDFERIRFDEKGDHLIAITPERVQSWSFKGNAFEEGISTKVTVAISGGVTAINPWAFGPNKDDHLVLTDLIQGSSLCPPIKVEIAAKLAGLDYSKSVQGAELVGLISYLGAWQIRNVKSGEKVASGNSPKTDRFAFDRLGEEFAVWGEQSGSHLEVRSLHNPEFKQEHLFSGAPTAVAFDAPERIAVATGNFIELLGSESSARRLVPSHEGPVRELVFSSEGTWVASGSEDGTTRIWNARNHEMSCAPLLHPAEVQSVCWRPARANVATLDSDGVIRVWEMATSTPAKTSLYGCRLAKFLPGGKSILAHFSNGTLQWFKGPNLEGGVPILTNASIVDFSFTPSGHLLLLENSQGEPTLPNNGPSASQLLRIYDIESARQLGPAVQGQGIIASATDEKELHLAVLSATEPRSLRIYNLSTQQELGSFPLKGAFAHVEFVPGEPVVQLMASNGLTQLIPFGGESARKSAGKSWSAHTRFHSQGRFYVEAEGAALRFREIGSNRPLSPLQYLSGTIADVAINENGAMAAVALRDGQIHLVEPRTGIPYGPPLKVGRPTYVEWSSSPDDRLLTLSANGLVSIFELPKTSYSSKEILQLSQMLCGHEMDSTGTMMPLSAGELRERWEKLLAGRTRDFFRENLSIAETERKQALRLETHHDWKGALEAFERLIVYRPSAEVYGHLGRALAMLGDFKSAGTAFSRAAELEPGGIQWLAFKAETQLARNSLDEFKLTGIKIRDLYQKQASRHTGRLLADLAVLIADSPLLSSSVEALQDLNEEPGDQVLHGAVAFRRGAYAQARDLLESSRRSAPDQNDLFSTLFLAAANARLGQPNTARQLFYEVLQHRAESFRETAGWEAAVELAVLVKEFEPICTHL